MPKVVINRRYGGFGLSEAAYEWLIAKGVPVRKYIEQKRGPDGLYEKVPENEGECIFDRDLSDPKDDHDRALRSLCGRYWETWIDGKRELPLLIECVETLGKESWGDHAELSIVEVPDGIDYEISEYDGLEHIAETHRTWR